MPIDPKLSPAAAAADRSALPAAWRPPAAPAIAPSVPVAVAGVPGAPVVGVPVPGVPVGVPTALMATSPLVTGVVEPIEAPAIEEFPTAGFYPSILHIGPSGTGKSEGIGALIDVGFNVLVVLAEPKGATYVKRRPNIVQIARAEWTYADRYDRMMRFADELAAGKYRTGKDGRPFDAIGLDGFTEIGDYVEAKFANMSRAGSGTFDYYKLIGAKLMGLFRIIRDAAGIAAAQAGQPPIVVMATCAEKLGRLGEGNNQKIVWMPQLPGQIAGSNIERHFETIWSYETGFNEMNAFEFRIWTQSRPGRMGKSTPIFNVCERGPGAFLNNATKRIDGWPHAGVMFARMLADPRSPYYRADIVSRVQHLWGQ